MNTLPEPVLPRPTPSKPTLTFVALMLCDNADAISYPTFTFTQELDLNRVYKEMDAGSQRLENTRPLSGKLPTTRKSFLQRFKVCHTVAFGTGTDIEFGDISCPWHTRGGEDAGARGEKRAGARTRACEGGGGILT